MAGFYSANVADGIKEAIAKEKKDMKVFNVMLLGKTGVGKSTLINNLFSERIAQTGIGKPVTQDIRLYKKEGFPLQVYDPPGFELAGTMPWESSLTRSVMRSEGDIKALT